MPPLSFWLETIVYRVLGGIGYIIDGIRARGRLMRRPPHRAPRWPPEGFV